MGGKNGITKSGTVRDKSAGKNELQTQPSSA